MQYRRNVIATELAGSLDLNMNNQKINIAKLKSSQDLIMVILKFWLSFYTLVNINT